MPTAVSDGGHRRSIQPRTGTALGRRLSPPTTGTCSPGTNSRRAPRSSTAGRGRVSGASEGATAEDKPSAGEVLKSHTFHHRLHTTEHVGPASPMIRRMQPPLDPSRDMACATAFRTKARHSCSVIPSRQLQSHHPVMYADPEPPMWYGSRKRVPPRGRAHTLPPSCCTTETADAARRALWRCRQPTLSLRHCPQRTLSQPATMRPACRRSL